MRFSKFGRRLDLCYWVGITSMQWYHETFFLLGKVQELFSQGVLLHMYVCIYIETICYVLTYCNLADESNMAAVNCRWNGSGVVVRWNDARFSNHVVIEMVDSFWLSLVVITVRIGWFVSGWIVSFRPCNNHDPSMPHDKVVTYLALVNGGWIDSHDIALWLKWWARFSFLL